MELTLKKAALSLLLEDFQNCQSLIMQLDIFIKYVNQKYSNLLHLIRKNTSENFFNVPMD